MPEVEHTLHVNASHEAVWDFVKEMDNWAPFMLGYQSHEVIDERESIWTLKGDVGVLARTVRMRVQIREWGPERVTFTLAGIGERVDGEGVFTLAPASSAAPAAEPAPASPPRRQGLIARLMRLVYRRMRARDPVAAPAARPAARPGPDGCRLGFRVRIESSGPVGPVMDAMIEPMLEPAAADLAGNIAARVEQAQATA